MLQLTTNHKNISAFNSINFIFFFHIVLLFFQAGFVKVQDDINNAEWM